MTNRSQKLSSNTAPRRWAMAGLLLGLFLVVLAMAQFEALHHYFHADAEHAEHQCAVTMLAGGQVDFSPTLISVSTPSVFTFVSALPETLFQAAPDHYLPLGRGPPARLS